MCVCTCINTKQTKKNMCIMHVTFSGHHLHINRTQNKPFIYTFAEFNTEIMHEMRCNVKNMQLKVMFRRAYRENKYMKFL